MYTLFAAHKLTRKLWALTQELQASLTVGVWYLCIQRLKMIPSLPILRTSIRASLYTMSLSTYDFKFVHIDQKDWYFSLWTPTIQRLEIGNCNLQRFPDKSKAALMDASFSLVLQLPGHKSCFYFPPEPPFFLFFSCLFLLKIKSYEFVRQVFLCTDMMYIYYIANSINCLKNGVQLIITCIFEKKKWTFCCYWAVKFHV